LTIPKMGSIIPNMGMISHKPAAGKGDALSVADALFTKSQQRVLALIFGNPGRTFYANELIALAGSGSGAVQRELAKLERAGLVGVTRVGNQKHYRANVDAPVFAPLRELILKTSGLADVLRASLASIGGRIRAAFVYGSVATRQDTAVSDIDLMIISDDLSYADLFTILEDASKRLGRAVNPTIYSGSELTKRLRGQNAFITRVLKQPKIWLIGGARDLPTR
jgi:predicted nucleotidyltransferase